MPAALPAPPAPQTFTAQLELRGGGPFVGTLGDMAAALRSGEVQPGQLPLLELTRLVLAWVHDPTHGDMPVEALPALAAVIALKARLLVPQQDTAPDPGDDLDDLAELGGDWPVQRELSALAELGALVDFLSERRRQRTGLIPVPAPAPGLELPRRQRGPRRERNLSRLLDAARSAVRVADTPLLARERLTLADALSALRAFGRRLGAFAFSGITVQDWGERTTYFAALLEGVKQGEFLAEQPQPYGEIQITAQPAAATATDPSPPS